MEIIAAIIIAASMPPWPIIVTWHGSIGAEGITQPQPPANTPDKH